MTQPDYQSSVEEILEQNFGGLDMVDNPRPMIEATQALLALIEKAQKEARQEEIEKLMADKYANNPMIYMWLEHRLAELKENK